MHTTTPTKTPRVSTRLLADEQEGETRSKRRANELARVLLDEVAQQGWRSGHSLGSESELMKARGVSRSVLRQAVKLLEYQGVATMRRGMRGGLVVSNPDLSGTLRAASLYLDARGIRPRDVLRTRKVLEVAAVSLAIERLDDAGVQALREVIDGEKVLTVQSPGEEVQRLHELIGTLAGDPVLLLFLQIVLKLTQEHSSCMLTPDPQRVARVKRMHRQIAEAIIERDTATASQLLVKYLDGFKAWMD